MTTETDATAPDVAARPTVGVACRAALAKAWAMWAPAPVEMPTTDDDEDENAAA